MDKRKPFVTIPKTIATDDDLSIQARSVYMALATFVDDQAKNGQPSRKNTANRAGVSLSRLSGYLSELESKGYITVIQQYSKIDGRKLPNRYQLNDV